MGNFRGIISHLNSESHRNIIYLSHLDTRTTSRQPQLNPPAECGHTHSRSDAQVQWKYYLCSVFKLQATLGSALVYHHQQVFSRRGKVVPAARDRFQEKAGGNARAHPRVYTYICMNVNTYIQMYIYICI